MFDQTQTSSNQIPPAPMPPSMSTMETLLTSSSIFDKLKSSDTVNVKFMDFIRDNDPREMRFAAFISLADTELLNQTEQGDDPAMLMLDALRGDPSLAFAVAAIIKSVAMVLAQDAAFLADLNARHGQSVARGNAFIDELIERHGSLPHCIPYDPTARIGLMVRLQSEFRRY